VYIYIIHTITYTMLGPVDAVQSGCKKGGLGGGGDYGINKIYIDI